MIPVTVTARIDGPTIGLVERPIMLDGPLAWVAWQHSGLTGPLPAEPVDFELPLARWEIDGVWGWQVSAGVVEVAASTATQIRRKPATAEMSRYTTDRKHHNGLGPHKARDTVAAVAWVQRITWHATVTDRARLAVMLADLAHLGKHHSRGYGAVHAWDISPGPADGWRSRPLPHVAGTLRGVRPPYHHPSRKVACA